MTERVWKRMSYNPINLSSMLKEEDDTSVTNKNTWLDFSKWFEYEDTNLAHVHNSPSETKNLNDEKVSNYLWQDVSSYKLSDSEMSSFINWLDLEQTHVATRMIDEGYSNDAMVAYIKNWDLWENPKATWTWMFQKKWGKTKSSWFEEWKEYRSPSWIGVPEVAQGVGYVTLWWLWLEWIWQFIQHQWNKLYNETVKPTGNDVELMEREALNKKAYDYFNKRAEKIKKEMDWLVEWDPKWEELNKQYNQEISNRNRYSPTWRKTTQQLQNEANIAWDYFNMAVDTDFEAIKRWSENVEPYIKSSNAKFKKIDFINRLTPELFSNVDEYTWEKQYKPVIEEMKEVFSKSWEISLEELENWKKTFQPSKQFLAWDTTQATMRDIHDKLYAMLRTEIKSTLETENPWKWVWNQYSEYGRWLEASDESLKKAKKEMTKEEKPAKWWKEKIEKKLEKTFGRWFKTKLAVAEKKFWEAISPSTWIKSLSNWLSKNWTKVEETLKDVATTPWTVRKMNMTNPYDIFLQYMLEDEEERLGIEWLSEPLIFPIAEWAAYEYEMSKLGKKEKEKAENQLENQAWYKELLEKEKGNTNTNWMTYEEIEKVVDSME